MSKRRFVIICFANGLPNVQLIFIERQTFCSACLSEFTFCSSTYVEGRFCHFRAWREVIASLHNPRTESPKELSSGQSVSVALE